MTTVYCNNQECIHWLRPLPSRKLDKSFGVCEEKELDIMVEKYLPTCQCFEYSDSPDGVHRQEEPE